MDEREIWVFEDDTMGCSECYEDRLDESAILPPHEQPHKQLDAGICESCGYVLDPSLAGQMRPLVERLLDAAVIMRYVPHTQGDLAMRTERPQRHGEHGVAGLSDDLRSAADALAKMAGRLSDAGVDKTDLCL